MYLMIAGAAVAVIVGFWPVRVDVVGDSSYYCGSGFIHSQHTWVSDGKVLINERSGALGIGNGLPRNACPDKILNNRDAALWIAGFVVVFGVLILALTARPQSRSTQAIFATQRLRSSRR
jgi:hypothetical protein